ncbi:MAG: helix-turn-helix domain-containing protein [Candidatus Omnitrophica bacterium]|nr:helix-turn-helix domain-containing protein [Candidatus Omnitrophota bacterium]
MPEKMMTLRELSDYLGVSEEKITSLVEMQVITAYKIGGELLRFRKDQIDAIQSEIYSRVKDADRIKVSDARRSAKERARGIDRAAFNVTLGDRLSDFLYFNDFYIFSGVLIVILLAIIFLG